MLRTYEGGCHCGRVRFRIEVEIDGNPVKHIDGLVHVIHHLVGGISAIGFAKTAETGKQGDPGRKLFKPDGIDYVSDPAFISIFSLRGSEFNPRRRLPDRVLLVGRPEIQDHVDRGRIDSGLLQQRTAEQLFKVLGELKGGYVAASETCALDILGAKLVREMGPGEWLKIEDGSVVDLPPLPRRPSRRCIFELIYFSRPDSTVFGHLSGFAHGIHRRERVEQGQIIGYVGQTGWATGPHLHYEFRIAGVARNPLAVTLPAAAPVPAGELTSFRRHAQPLVAQLDLLAASTVALLE